MKNMIKFLALALVIVSVLAISAPALAATETLSPGSSVKYLYDITSAPSYNCSLKSGTPSGYYATFTLNYNDLTVSPTTWKKSNSITLTSGTNPVGTLKQDANVFKFVSGRTDRAQVVVRAGSVNGGNITVSF